MSAVLIVLIAVLVVLLMLVWALCKAAAFEYEGPEEPWLLPGADEVPSELVTERFTETRESYPMRWTGSHWEREGT